MNKGDFKFNVNIGELASVTCLDLKVSSFVLSKLIP